MTQCTPLDDEEIALCAAPVVAKFRAAVLELIAAALDDEPDASARRALHEVRDRIAAL